jgi:hypothetical protein
MTGDAGPGRLNFGGEGLLYRLALGLGWRPGHGVLVRVGIAIAVFTWVPLVALSALDGTLLGGSTISLAQSLGTHVRLLVAIPLFFLAESMFGARIGEVLRGLLGASIVAREDAGQYTSDWRTARQLWDSRVAMAALVLVTAVSIYAGLRTDVPAGVTTWRTGPAGRTSVAGWWYVLVGLPIFQFLLWRWTWHLLVWGRLIWQISRLDLRLLPTHPDSAGGLGPFGVAHVDLSPFAFAASAMLAASVAEQVMFGGARTPDYLVPLAAFVIVLTVVLIAPLSLFSARLLEVKQVGLLEYGALASRYTEAFDTKWLRRERLSNEEMLGAADVQSLADLSNSFGVIRDMRLLPISMRQVLMLAASGALPMLPLTLFEIPLRTLMSSVIQSIVGI